MQLVRVRRRQIARWSNFLFVLALFSLAASLDAAQGNFGAQSSPYLIRCGDELEITFFYHPELNQKVVVRPDGRISMPLIGDVTVENIAPGDLARQLAASYQEQLKHPSVNVQIHTFSDQIIYIAGEVSRPGPIALHSELTALEAIVAAGGLKDSAARGSLFVLRKGQGGKLESYRVGMRQKNLLPPESATFALRPLDVVVVAESGISRLDRVMDDYVKKLTPVLLTGGFTYLFGPASGIVTNR